MNQTIQPEPGRLQTIYRVKCKACGTLAEISASTRAVACRRFEDWGWIHHSSGWLCGACVREGVLL